MLFTMFSGKLVAKLKQQIAKAVCCFFISSSPSLIAVLSKNPKFLIITITFLIYYNITSIFRI